MNRFENLKIGRKLKATSFKRIGSTKQLAAWSLKLAAFNEEQKIKYQSTILN